MTLDVPISDLFISYIHVTFNDLPVLYARRPRGQVALCKIKNIFIAQDNIASPRFTFTGGQVTSLAAC